MVPIHFTVSRTSGRSNPAAEHLECDPARAGDETLEGAMALRRAFVVQFGWCCQRCRQSFWWRDEDGLILLVQRHLRKCKGERYWDED